MAFTNEQLQADFQWAKYQWLPNETVIHQEMEHIINYLLGNSTKVPVLTGWSLYYRRFTVGLLSKPIGWDGDDETIMAFITKRPVWKIMAGDFFDRLGDDLRDYPNEGLFLKAVTKLTQHGIDETELLKFVLGDSNSSVFGCTSTGYGNIGYRFFDYAELTKAICAYLVSVYPTYQKEIQKYLGGHRSYSLLIYILQRTNIDPLPFWYYQEDGKTLIYVENVVNTLAVFPEKYEKEAYRAFRSGEVWDYEGTGVANATKYVILRKLAELFPATYRAEQLQIAHQSLISQQARNFTKNSWGQWVGLQYVTMPQPQIEDEWTWQHRTRFLDDLFIEDFLAHDPAHAMDTLLPYFNQFELPSIPVEAYTTVEKHLGEKSVDLLAIALGKYKGEAGEKTLDALLEALGKHDFSQHYDKLWNLTKDKYKAIRFKAIQTLQKYLGEKAIPHAESLLKTSKNADQRQFMALLLAMIGSDQALQILMDALEQEKNDDARDVMLQTLVEQREKNAGEPTIAELVASAKKRGKLEKPIKKWLDEASLPALKYKTGRELDLETIRFLFYRQSRAKEIRTDVEARPLFQLIDRQTSGDFARKVWQLFVANGADAKQKYCLTIAGLLGDERLVETFRKQISEWDLNKRGKMAEYALVALAFMGSNKALRTVEYFSRKAKNGNVMSAGRQALEIAAEELGMDLDQLSDSIVPDLGFEGVFKAFNIGQDEYRAFVGNDFKITFFDEDNKKFKSLPKAAPKELQNEFKELSKELREVVRLQSDRMERYLVTQRKWTVEAWQAFYLNNPIMFVYALRLVWGVFDEQNQLLYAFQCTDDGTLVDKEDEEIKLEERQLVGMIHPLSMEGEEVDVWVQRLSDSGIEPIFPQLQRPTVPLDPAHYQHVESRLLYNVPFNQSIRRTWNRGSIGDGGMIENYFRTFMDGAILAFLDVNDMDVFGYMDNGTFDSLYFVKGGTTGEKIPFGEVPPIIYSEVMGDLKQLMPVQAQ